jgi:hypothetical protein
MLDRAFLVRHRLLIGVTWVILLCAWFRFYNLGNPPTDWHAFRQADTASVTREYVKHGVDVLRPRYQDHSNIQSGKDNPEGWRMVEFPVMNAGVAQIVRWWPTLDLVVASRLSSILLSIGTTVYLTLLVTRWSGWRTGFWAGFFFASLPFSVFYGRAILPEPGLLFFGVGSLYWFQRWLDEQTAPTYLSSALHLSLAFLLKPFIAFYGLVFVVATLQTLGKKFWKNPWLWVYPVLAVGPFLGWREWIKQYPEGIPASDWLFNSDGIRLRPAWFRWLGYERLTKLILGWGGVPFFALGGLWKFGSRDWWLYASWWVGLAVYLIWIATGNVRHDYYQVLLLPAICATLARGLVGFLHWSNVTLRAMQVSSHTTRTALATLTALVLIGTWFGSWQYLKGYYRTRPDWETAGRVVDQLTPPNAKVIAPAFGDTAFLFQTNRTGWPIGFSIEEKIENGAEYYITTSYDDEARELEQKHRTVVKTPDYLLLDLTP